MQMAAGSLEQSECRLENYIQDNMKKEMVEMQQNAVQNQTAVMIEIGTSLLNQTAAQTRKLTDVEAQVLNQTTRLELQLLEHSLSTNKLEKQILDQTSEINKLQDKNSFLEKKVLDMEDKHVVQLQSIKEEKDQLQVLVSKQNSIIEELEKQLVTATVNNSALQKQQQDLMETVHSLLTMLSTSSSKHSLAAKDEQIVFRDCAEAFKSGLATSGVYTLTFPNSTQETKGFGNPSGEYWLGNEFVSQVTNQKRYMLKIRLTDWEGNEAHSLYEHFSLSGEELNYRQQQRDRETRTLMPQHHQARTERHECVLLSREEPRSARVTGRSEVGDAVPAGPTGTGPTGHGGTAQAPTWPAGVYGAQTGGWWFDACGPSNLNGMYYPQRQSTNKFNGIKWYYWKGSGYSLKATAMMIRPADF
ncbi:Angiopoietin-2 [Pteropus alecto]|uniref:Angiopoietin-2 n=1 Tax=Pteropus alecto TaxID=9402 RepID=L5KH17_PTEAL|nr:Angiopoietin-2 [Pteropus alecto]